jgi:hypothetical protein
MMATGRRGEGYDRRWTGSGRTGIIGVICWHQSIQAACTTRLCNCRQVIVFPPDPVLQSQSDGTNTVSVCAEQARKMLSALVSNRIDVAV